MRPEIPDTSREALFHSLVTHRRSTASSRPDGIAKVVHKLPLALTNPQPRSPSTTLCMTWLSTARADTTITLRTTLAPSQSHRTPHPPVPLVRHHAHQRAAVTRERRLLSGGSRPAGSCPQAVPPVLCLRPASRLISEHTPCCTQPGANPPHSATALGPATDLAEPINRIEPNPPSPAQEPSIPTLYDAGPSAPVRMDHQQRGRFVPFNVDASRPAGRSDQLAAPTLHSDFVPAALTNRPG